MLYFTTFFIDDFFIVVRRLMGFNGWDIGHRNEIKLDEYENTAEPLILVPSLPDSEMNEMTL